MDKNKMRKFTLSLLVFVVGTFSVTVSNIFNGHFAGVIVAEIVASTIYLNCILEEKEAFNKNNLVNLILIGFVVFMNLLFFVTNDIVGKDVYIGDLSKFWDICVVGSQFVSLCALVYTLVMFVMNSNKNHIEIVENYEQKSFKEEIKEKIKDEIVEHDEEKIEEKEQEQEIVKEVKSIKENNVEIETPFMEEEN